MELEHTTVNLPRGRGQGFFYGHGQSPRELGGRDRALGQAPGDRRPHTAVKLILGLCGRSFRAAGVTPWCGKLHTGGPARARPGAIRLGKRLHPSSPGVGGGKCLGSRLRATFARLDLICVPTSVATCVGLLCLMYHMTAHPGRLGGQPSKEATGHRPIIATAPKRLLAAGIFDSLAKHPRWGAQHPNWKLSGLYSENTSARKQSRSRVSRARVPGTTRPRLGPLHRMWILTNLLHTSVSGFPVNQLALAHGLYADFTCRSFTACSRICCSARLWPWAFSCSSVQPHGRPMCSGSRRLMAHAAAHPPAGSGLPSPRPKFPAAGGSISPRHRPSPQMNPACARPLPRSAENTPFSAFRQKEPPGAQNVRRAALSIHFSSFSRPAVAKAAPTSPPRCPWPGNSDLQSLRPLGGAGRRVAGDKAVAV